MVKGGVRSKNYWGHHSRLEAVLESLESEREKSSHSANVWSLFMISPELVLGELSKSQEREFRTSCLYPLKIIKKFESKSAKLQNCHGYQNLMFHSIHYNCSHSLARLRMTMMRLSSSNHLAAPTTKRAWHTTKCALHGQGWLGRQMLPKFARNWPAATCTIC